MSVKIPAYTDIGKAARELLQGGKEGVFQFNQALSLSSKTADGVEFVASTVNDHGAIQNVLKTSYRAKNYALIGSFGSSGKVSLTGTLTDLAPGLAASLSGTIPDQNSGKLALDYSIPHLTLKTVVGLSPSPKIDVAATTGHEGFVVGAQGVYDTNKAAITSYNLAAGYTGLDYQVGLHLLDLGETVKAAYAHNLDAFSVAGAEVTRKLGKDEPTTFTLGYSRRLEGGALTKAKLDNAGVLSYLYEQELKPKTKLALSVQLNALNLNQEPKYGFALSHAN